MNSANYIVEEAIGQFEIGDTRAVGYPSVMR